MSTCGLLFQ